MTEPQRIAIDAEDVGRGFGRLVVAVLDLVRQLLERQALRRVDAGSLGPDEIERLGQALLGLEQQLAGLRDLLGVSEHDLALPLEIADLDPTTERRTP
ncbi:MAG TPA: gas vesicle protein K [Kofleriaceae bacterium]|nr:gas vesicle protein K [Kofleriaceae bacterium]